MNELELHLSSGFVQPELDEGLRLGGDTTGRESQESPLRNMTPEGEVSRLTTAVIRLVGQGMLRVSGVPEGRAMLSI
jgi:hypothetical protein